MDKRPGNNKTETGKMGEDYARQWLREQGYEVLAQNWRYSHYEIDLIAAKAGDLHFVEVKTLWNFLGIHPEEKVKRRKLQFLKRAAEFYLYANPHWKHIQFDVISVTLFPDRQPEIFYIADVF